MTPCDYPGQGPPPQLRALLLPEPQALLLPEPQALLLPQALPPEPQALPQPEPQVWPVQRVWLLVPPVLQAQRA